MTASAPLLCIPAPTRAGAGRQVRQLSRAGSHFHHSRSFQADQLPDCIPLPPSSHPFLAATVHSSTNQCHRRLGKVGNHH